MNILFSKLNLVTSLMMIAILSGCSSTGIKSSSKQVPPICSGNSCDKPKLHKHKVHPTPKHVYKYRKREKNTYLDHTVSWVAEQRSGSAYYKSGYQHVIYQDDISEPRSAYAPHAKKRAKPIGEQIANHKDLYNKYKNSIKPKFNEIPADYLALYTRYCSSTHKLSPEDQSMIKLMGGKRGIPPSLKNNCKR